MKTIKKGKNHGFSGTNMYKIWKSMRVRCDNKNQIGYKNYGGRGIKYCERWDKFINFYEDMKATYKIGLSLDRINNDGNYETSNCRWVTKAGQTRNTRQNHFITFKGETLVISDWAKRLGMKRLSLYSRIKRGWSIEEAFELPLAGGIPLRCRKQGKFSSF